MFALSKNNNSDRLTATVELELAPNPDFVVFMIASLVEIRILDVAWTEVVMNTWIMQCAS